MCANDGEQFLHGVPAVQFHLPVECVFHLVFFLNHTTRNHHLRMSDPNVFKRGLFIRRASEVPLHCCSALTRGRCAEPKLGRLLWFKSIPNKKSMSGSYFVFFIHLFNQLELSNCSLVAAGRTSRSK